MNKENLLKLATYLLSDNLKANFDMKWFTDSRAETPEIFLTECGTVGCAVGHGPYAGIEKLNSEDWVNYSYRCFFNLSHVSRLSPTGVQWRWCFSYGWSAVDNTPQGAAKRILHMIRKGVPENWFAQLAGQDELSYTNETL